MVLSLSRKYVHCDHYGGATINHQLSTFDEVVSEGYGRLRKTPGGEGGVFTET
jgi:hypothetical protein